MRKLILACTFAVAACDQPQPQVPVTAETAKPAAQKPAEPVIKEITISSSSPEAVTEFKKGRELVENVRTTEAIPFFKKAIELDPSFALAHAYLGRLTPGPEGLKEIETAVQSSAALPEAERLFVEVELANRKGEVQKVDELTKKLSEVAPTEWRVHAAVGHRAFDRGDWPAATAALKKAAELNPKSGTVQNLLGYAALEQGKKEEAIEAFKKYAELSPTEPNPHDSLGDALLASGKLEEAAASYKKAFEVAPAFCIALGGVAQTHALRGDWAGAEEAFTKAKEAASSPRDKVHLLTDLAWTQFSAGKTKEALKSTEEAEKEAVAGKLEDVAAFPMVDRAAMLVEMNKAADALKLVQAAVDRATKAGMPGGPMMHLQAFALHVRANAEAKLQKKVELEKTVQEIVELVKKDPTNTRLVSMQHDVEGLAAMVGGDAKVAVEHYTKCVDDDSICALHRVEAEEKAGNKAAADEVRAKLTGTPRRDTRYLYVRAKLGTIAKN
jgi:tetratricopeptide (TPR) repeat protein